MLVDGGVASAFPVFLFDTPEPRHPTWGFRLYSGMGRERPARNDVDGLDWPIEMGWAILDTAMNAFDRRNLVAFGDRTVSIPTGDVGPLDFDLSRDEREFLYGSGYEAGRAFFAAGPSGRNSFGAVAPAGN